MELKGHKLDELQKTIQLQNEHIQQLTEHNRQCLENNQKQNTQIELLSRQLTEAHNQQQLLLQRLRLQQQQQQQQLCEDDAKHRSSSNHQFSSSASRLHNGVAHESSLSTSAAADADCRIAQLEAELSETRWKLEESERQRQLCDEQAEKSRVSYESEISWLKIQLSTFEADFTSERRAREATATTLDQVRAELTAAQRQLHEYSLQQMQDLKQRREAALDYYRREYERTHPQQQQQQQRPIYQTDSNRLNINLEEDGEDEID